MANIRCPLCSKTNPIEAEICLFCNARLKPLIKPPFEQGKDNLSAGISPEPNTNLPEWLQDLRQQGDDSEPVLEPSESLPDWLKSSVPEASDTPASSALTGDDSGEAPDWLSRIQGVTEEETDVPLLEENPDAGTSDAPALGEEPEWLKRIRARQQFDENDPAPFEPGDVEETPVEGELPPAESAPTTFDFPDWLSNLGTTPEDSSSLPTEEMPDWFSQGRDLIPSQLPSPEEPEYEEEAAPSWLSNLGMPGLISEDKEELLEDELSEETELLSEEEGMPDWLSRLSGSPGEAAPAVLLEDIHEALPPEEKPETVNESDLENLPDWISQVSGEESPVPAAPIEIESDASISHADLPRWLEAMRPVESAAPTSFAKEDSNDPAESSGPLVGLHSVLPVETGFASIKKPPAYSIRLQVSEAQRLHVALLEKMLSSEAESKTVSSRPVISSQYLLRLLIALILLTAVVLPLVMDIKLLPASRLMPGGIRETYNLIASIPSGSPVLVAIDYEPGFAGELEAASAGLINQLLDQGAHLTLVSTSPTGPVVAQRFINSFDSGNLVSGVNYANLGYISGGASGLVSFAESPRKILPFSLDARTVWDSIPLNTVNSLADFSLVVVVTEKADVARTWIEQVEPILDQKDKKMVMVISSQAEPLVRPYYTAPSTQLGGLIAGFPGGSAYESLGGVSADRVRTYWDSYGAGIFVAVVLLVFGGLISSILAVLASRKETEGEVSL